MVLFHDENGNGKLDSSYLRVPQEPYGFSNKKRGIFDLKSFEDSKFSLDEPLKVLVIEVN